MKTYIITEEQLKLLRDSVVDIAKSHYCENLVLDWIKIAKQNEQTT